MSREELKNLTPEQANAKIKELNEQIKNEKDPKKLNAMNNDLKDLHNEMELRAITEKIDELKKEKEELLKIPKENMSNNKKDKLKKISRKLKDLHAKRKSIAQKQSQENSQENEDKKEAPKTENQDKKPQTNSNPKNEKSQNQSKSEKKDEDSDKSKSNSDKKEKKNENPKKDDQSSKSHASASKESDKENSKRESMEKDKKIIDSIKQDIEKLNIALQALEKNKNDLEQIKADWTTKREIVSDLKNITEKIEVKKEELIEANKKLKKVEKRLAKKEAEERKRIAEKEREAKEKLERKNAAIAEAKKLSESIKGLEDQKNKLEAIYYKENGQARADIRRDLTQIIEEINQKSTRVQELQEQYAITKEDLEKDEPPQNDPPQNDPPQNDPPQNDPPQNDPPQNDPPQNDPPQNDPPKTGTSLLAEQKESRMKKIGKGFINFFSKIGKVLAKIYHATIGKTRLAKWISNRYINRKGDFPRMPWEKDSELSFEDIEIDDEEIKEDVTEISEPTQEEPTTSQQTEETIRGDAQDRDKTHAVFSSLINAMQSGEQKENEEMTVEEDTGKVGETSDVDETKKKAEEGKENKTINYGGYEFAGLDKSIMEKVKAGKELLNSQIVTTTNGVEKWINPDGTLTDQPKARYGDAKTVEQPKTIDATVDENGRVVEDDERDR